MKSYIPMVLLLPLLLSHCVSPRFNPSGNIPEYPYDRTRWIDTRGPEGADATAFYIDRNGNWWLGTGSSGGVYVSGDQGETWKAVNAGIGPVHVTTIAEIDHSLHIQVASDKSRKQAPWSWFSPGSSMLGHPVNLYQFDRSIKSWRLLTNRIETGKKSKIFRSIPWEKWSDPPYGHVLFPSGNQKLSGWKFNETRYPRGTRSVSKQLTINKRKIILSKTGLFLKSRNAFARIPLSNVQATDIHQIIRTANRVYALVNDYEIHLLENRKWHRLYDCNKRRELYSDPMIRSHQYRLNSKGNHNPGPLKFESETDFTKNLHPTPDGKLLFIANSSIVTIDHKGIAKILHRKKHEKIRYRNRTENLYLSYTSAVYDRDGSLWFTGKLLVSTNRIFRNIVGRYMKGSQSPEIIRELTPTPYLTGKMHYKIRSMDPVLFTDSRRNIWLAWNRDNGQSITAIIEMLSGKDILKSRFTDNNNHFLSRYHISEGSGGTIAAYLALNRVILWKPGAGWKMVPAGKMGGISCLGFDRRGTLLAGTGEVTYGYGMCGAGGPLGYPHVEYGSARGVFRLEGLTWKKIPGEPNPKILSIIPDGKHGALIGTSGSGVFGLKTGP